MSFEHYAPTSIYNDCVNFRRLEVGLDESAFFSQALYWQFCDYVDVISEVFASCLFSYSNFYICLISDIMQFFRLCFVPEMTCYVSGGTTGTGTLNLTQSLICVFVSS